MQTRHLTTALVLSALPTLIGCASSGAGHAWEPPPFETSAPDALTPDELDALHAFEALVASPDDEDAIIWYGRRLAYLGEYERAIEVYTRGLALRPESPKLLRHRGHRFVSTRRFDRAVDDFVRAAELIEGTVDEVEPDGKPNERGIPTSTLHTNVWYHLGLARYCRGEFDEALAAYEHCLAASKNPDMEAATRYWMVLTAQRLDDEERVGSVLAAVDPDWDIIENEGYHDLLLLFRGDRTRAAIAPDGTDEVADLTLAYGLARHRFVEGHEAEGWEALCALAQRGSPAFGCIAAEADVARAGL